MGWRYRRGQPARLVFLVAVAGFLLLTLLRTRLLQIGTTMMSVSTLVVALMPGVTAPDVVIAEDGSLVAIVNRASLASNRERPPRFIFDQWKRALVIDDRLRPQFIDAGSAPIHSAKASERTKLSPEQ
jgi:competence protein ComEC